ncbi:MAG: UDP-3-O-acyl-N-acetylglucosamine deacetylase [Rhizobiales bacterium]|nr:UDP-3-O-acyl-N-acetylglucosamine deacetylase [Hyphomicrobiales bacterium]
MARRQPGKQTTLRNRVALSGVGVHCGRSVAVTLHPAEADTGITFLRTGIEGGCDREVPADYRFVRPTDLCTTVADGEASIATIEHIMAALRGAEIDNVVVEIDGGEVPVMDGSADAFLRAFDQAGVKSLAASRRYIRIERAVRVEVGNSYAEFRPFNGARVEVEIDFANSLIGRQAIVVDVTPDTFRSDLSRARTFGFLADVEALWARGLCLGASLDNAIVVGDDRVINPEGLRYSDEFVRHKALDAFGDIALAGAPILGSYRSYRGGHRLNVMAVEALMSETDAWSYVEAPAPRRESGYAPLSAGVAAVAFGPEVS